MAHVFELIREERAEDQKRELPCRDFDWDCLATDGVIPFGDYRKCQLYDPECGKCLFITSHD